MPARAFALILTCALWLSLALPNLPLVPGLGGPGDGRIAISLQSALLGIDDGAGRPPVEVGRAAARALGLHASTLSAAPGSVGDAPPAGALFVAELAANFQPARPTAPSAGSDTAPSIASTSISAAVAGPSGSKESTQPDHSGRSDQPPASPPPPPAPAPAPARTAAPTAPPAPPRPQKPSPPAAPTPAPAPAAAPAAPSPDAPPPPAGPPMPGNSSPPPAPGPSAQTISFTSTAPSGAVVGGSAYAVAATASSGLPVSFGLAVSSAGVCTVSGSTVSLVGVGTCTVLADQAGNGSYLSAPQVQQWFMVGAPPPSAQAISFTSAPPAGAVVGGPTYTVTASATSGLPVSFSIAAASAGVCAVAGSTVTYVSTGTCTVNADQAGNGSYLAAPQVQQSFAVAPPPPSSQSITFTSTPPAAGQVGELYTVSATASSGLQVAFSIDSSSVGVCTISGSTITHVSTGTCRVNANQAGNGSYQAAPQVNQSYAITS